MNPLDDKIRKFVETFIADSDRIRFNQSSGYPSDYSWIIPGYLVWADVEMETGQPRLTIYTYQDLIAWYDRAIKNSKRYDQTLLESAWETLD